jgi:NADH:ubiquinone oxidoreductase subunit E
MPIDLINESSRDNLLKQHKKQNQTLAQIQSDRENILPMLEQAQEATECIDVQSVHEIKNL